MPLHCMQVLLIFHLEIMMIQPTLKQFESITICGFSTRTQNLDEFNEKTAKIPSLWQSFYAENALAGHSEVYGVYSNYESDANGFYTVTAGVPDVKNKAGLNETIIQSGRYLVFENEGPVFEMVIKTWQDIWDYFAKTTSYQRHFLTDFEYYTSKEKVAVYIGIR